VTTTTTTTLGCGLEDRPEGLALWGYTLQFLAFSIANSLVIPVIVGPALGLGAPEVASLVQRTFFFCAVGSFLQGAFGHRYPIFEGPAGIWYTVFLLLGSLATAVGKPLAVLRTDLEMGLLLAGGVTLALGLGGQMRRVAPLFTPLVNGIFLTVMSFQIAPSIARGMIGIAGEGRPSLRALAVGLVSVCVAWWLTLRARGFLGSIGILAGALAGFAAGQVLGLVQPVRAPAAGLLSAPELLAWGRPTFDPGVALTCVLAGVIVLANLVASVQGMALLTGTTADDRRMNRAAVFTGISDVLGGAGSVVGFIPYASSLGLVSVSRVSARLPFLLGTALLAGLALFPAVGQLLAGLPPAVGYSVLLVTFSQVVVVGLKAFAQSGLDARSGFIVGTSLLVGVGVMSLAPAQLEMLPVWARYLLGNGVIVATFLGLVLEQAVPRR
jgi:xanthine/uracil permease